MARGKIEIRHADLIDLLMESADSEFDREYVEAVVRYANRDDLAYYKELIEDREVKLREQERATEGDA